VTEIFGLENSVSRRWRDAPAFWTIFTVLIVVSVIIASLPDLPVVTLLLNLYVLNGILLPVILFSVLYLVNKKRLMGKYTNSLVLNIVAYTLAGIVSLLAIAFVVLKIVGIFIPSLAV
jgi:Mn2+/Fe2+ NRAMP family transporter